MIPKKQNIKRKKRGSTRANTLTEGELEPETRLLKNYEQNARKEKRKEK
jgi:hypothetical protein